jgi:hypothetical protein
MHGPRNLHATITRPLSHLAGSDGTLSLSASRLVTARETVDMDSNERTCFAEQLADLRSQAGLSLADVATAAHVARG